MLIDKIKENNIIDDSLLLEKKYINSIRHKIKYEVLK